MNLVKAAADVWRDFVTGTDPLSGAYMPKKLDIRTWGKAIEDYIASIIDGGAVSPTPSFALPGTLTAAMSGQTQIVNQTSAGQVTLPAPMAAGVTVPFAVLGAGVPTFVPATGATLVNRSGHTSAAGQYAFVVVMCIVGGAAPIYMLAGDTA